MFGSSDVRFLKCIFQGADWRNAQRIQYDNRLSASTTGSISPDPGPCLKRFSDFDMKNQQESKTPAWCHTGDTFFGKASLRDQADLGV